MSVSDRPAEDSRLPGGSSSISGSQFERLIATAQSGGDAEFAQLVRSCQGYLLLVANQELDATLKAKVGASDLVQNTLALAQQHMTDFRGTSRQALFAWLRKILRNEIHTTHRKFVQTEKRDLYREMSLDHGSQMRPAVADDCPSPQTEAIVHEEAIALREALRRLPGDHRAVVLLRNWERLPFDEIGRRLDRSTEAVKKLWSRAIVRLGTELGHESPTES